MSETAMDRWVAWVALFASRDEMAAEYAKLLSNPSGKFWPMLNLAIIDRWSEAGLVYIKRRAWKIAGGGS